MDKSTIDGATLFVKKIVSLNPDKFGFISLQGALEKYSKYLFTIHDDRKRESAKSFRQWLKTEI